MSSPKLSSNRKGAGAPTAKQVSGDGRKANHQRERLQRMEGEISKLRSHLDRKQKELDLMRTQFTEATHALNERAAEWEEKERKYEGVLRRLERSMKRKKETPFVGRGKYRRMNMDSNDHANMSIITNFLRNVMMPKHKFWHDSWMKYLPENRHSFYSQIQHLLDFPVMEDRKLYWEDHLIGVINKRRVDWNSNLDTRLQKQFKCKLT